MGEEGVKIEKSADVLYGRPLMLRNFFPFPPCSGGGKLNVINLKHVIQLLLSNFPPLL